MAKTRVKLLNGGREQVLSAASGFGSFTCHSFKVGTTAGFYDTVLPTETQPRGNVVFTGDSYLMQARLTSTDTSRLSMMLPEGSGPFDVGNVVMYTTGRSGEAIPFAMVVLAFPIPKVISAFDTGQGGLNLPNPGNRFLISITLKHEVLEAGDPDTDVVVNVVTPEYSNLPSYGTEVDLPAAGVQPWNQFILQRATFGKRPGLVTKTTDGQHYVMPFFRNVRNPKYNVLDGGVLGDDYRESPYEWANGGRFVTPESSYRGKMGGAPFRNSSGPATRRVGGVPFRVDD